MRGARKRGREQDAKKAVFCAKIQRFRDNQNRHSERIKDDNMCGIIGYFGKEQASPMLIEGLKRLEYRGYDSYGMATSSGGKLHIDKNVGKISSHNGTPLPGTVGIAHTRWATHGKVTVPNAHPHSDCTGRIAVVHNGIIENYQELRRILEARGHKFTSETDTEVIAHLVEDHLKGSDLKQASRMALSELEGNYAVAIITGDGKEMIGARKGSPLVLGVASDGYFLASDIPAFLPYTKNIIYLYEDDMVVVNGGIEIFSIKTGEKLERQVDSIDWTVEQAQKGDFAHFMLKEIVEQSDTIKNAARQDPASIKRVADAINEARGVFFVACGSSYHACLSGSYMFSKIAKRHVNVVLASEFPNYEDFLTDKTLVIAVSQSGETADVLEAVNAARRKNSKVISIVNVTGSTLTRHSDESILMNAGPEICVLSTKTYTSQLSILLLLAYAVVGQYERGLKELEYAWNIVYNLTSRNTREYISRLAGKMKDKEHVFIIGRDSNYPTAMEAALKIKEVSYIHAEGFAGGEIKHGPIALIEQGTPCITFVGSHIEKETLSNVMELKARGGYMIGISPRNNEVFDCFIKVPEIGNINPISQIIPIQILAYKLAILRGCDPDKPRNLAKSCTVK